MLYQYSGQRTRGRKFQQYKNYSLKPASFPLLSPSFSLSPVSVSIYVSFSRSLLSFSVTCFCLCLCLLLFLSSLSVAFSFSPSLSLSLSLSLHLSLSLSLYLSLSHAIKLVTQNLPNKEPGCCQEPFPPLFLSQGASAASA